MSNKVLFCGFALFEGSLTASRSIRYPLILIRCFERHTSEISTLGNVEERIEHNDYRWLGRLKDRIKQLTPDERTIFDELMSWKPPTKKIQTRLERLVASNKVDSWLSVLKNRVVFLGHKKQAFI